MSLFKKEHDPGKSADGQVLRVFNRFALIAAAGSLATELGIANWPEEETAWGVGACFREWLKERGSVGTQEDGEILRQVKHYLEQHGESRFTIIGSEGDRKTINRSGYRRKEDDSWIYFVLPESFRSDVCSGFNSTMVAKILIEKEWLIVSSDGKSTRAEKLPCSDKTTHCYRLDGSKIFSSVI